MKRKVPLWLWIVIVALVLLACTGHSTPGVALYDLSIGWAHYLYRVIPQVYVSWAGVVTAAVCLAALAVGLHAFLRWFWGARAVSLVGGVEIVGPWAGRWTAMILALVVLMFVAGISVVGISHQTAWLLASPESMTGGYQELMARTQQANNLKQLVLAMHNYQDAEGTLPPAAISSKDGRPLLSWRVLLLPYIEQQYLYKQFRLDQPWDSPHNLRLLRHMPLTYDSARRKGKDRPHSTHYLVFVGKGTVFEQRQQMQLGVDFPDGAPNTILIVDAAEAVPWTKPEDLPYDPAQPLPALGALSPKYFHAALADGSVRQINSSISDQTLRAAITRNGGETLGPDW